MTKVVLALVLVLQSLLPFGLLQPKSAFAYTTGMSASVVLGQPDFTSSTANNGGLSSNSLNSVFDVEVVDEKLLVADRVNNRVLIWNSIPTTNNKAADLVLGQPDFTSSTANNGGISASTLNGPRGIAYVNGKLFVADNGNNRILVWNSFPTSNQQAADFVLGQPNFTSSTANNGGRSAQTFSHPNNVRTNGSKLMVMDSLNQRVLIWNSIPTTTQQAADVVVGENSFTTATSGTSSQELNCSFSCDATLQGNYLVVMDRLNRRVVIWNSIPTSNYVAADVVLGQPDFISNTENNGGVSASSFSWPTNALYDGKRLFIGDDTNNRILVFNGVPTSNNASAFLVLGQSDFTSTTNSTSATSYSLGLGMIISDNKLIVGDGNRVLIYTNIINNPGLTLNNSPEGRDNGLLRLTGHVSLPSDSSYTLSSVQYSVNGGGFSGATASDGSFSGRSEDFYFDFDPKSNQQRDSSGNLIDGYTIRVKSTNSNLDVTDNLFYFSPFNLNEPLDNVITTSLYPTFDFSVIKQKSILKENLSKYQIQTRLGGSDSTAPWQTLIDDIPIDGTLDNTGAVVVDNDNFKAIYTDDSSRVKVYSKVKALAGSMQWKVVAVDKSGHSQDSNARSLRVNTNTSVTTSNFPLAVLNISGLGNPNISTTNLSAMKDTYNLGSLTPIFYGIAYTNAKVTLSLTDQSCDTTKSTDCTKTYSTTANPDSRYGINIPREDLNWGKKYTTNMSVALNQDYNELPTFVLSTYGSVVKPQVTPTPQPQIQEQLIPTPTPLPTPLSTPEPLEGGQEVSKKNCFLFWCF